MTATLDTSDLPQWGSALRALRQAFWSEHRRHPTRCVVSEDVANAMAENEVEIARRMDVAGISGLELNGSPTARGIRFVTVSEPPNTFYLDDKEGDEP